MKTYMIYEKGLYVGTMILTPREVREFTAAAIYILKVA